MFGIKFLSPFGITHIRHGPVQHMFRKLTALGYIIEAKATGVDDNYKEGKQKQDLQPSYSYLLWLRYVENKVKT